MDSIKEYLIASAANPSFQKILRSREIRGCRRYGECGVEATQNDREESEKVAERGATSRPEGLGLLRSNRKKGVGLLHGQRILAKGRLASKGSDRPANDRPGVRNQ
jgi:hypothetical protein